MTSICKYILIIIMSGLTGHWAIGQDQYKTAEKIDSLQEIVDDNPIADIVKIRQMQYLARYCFMDFQYARGYNILEDARDLANTLDFLEGEALYYQSMAIALPDELGIYFFIKSNWLLEELDLPIKLDPSIQDLGNVINIAMRRFPLKPDSTLMSNDLEIKRFNGITSSIKMASENESIWLPYLQYQLFKAEYEKGNLKDSFNAIEKALEEARQAGETSLEIIFTIQKCQFFSQIMTDEEINNQEIRFANQISAVNNLKESSLLQTFQIHYFMRKNDYATAVKIGLEIINQLESINESQLHSIITSMIGNQFAVLGLLNKANKYILTSVIASDSLVESGWDIGFETIISNNYFELGFNSIELDQADLAEVYFTKARQVMDKTDYLKSIYELRFRDGDAKGQLEMAKGNFPEALKIFHQVKEEFANFPWIFYINYYMAECYKELREWDNSLRYGLLSYERIKQLGADQNLEIRATLLMSDVYGELGDMENSFRYLTEFRKIVGRQNEQNLVNQTQKMEIEALLKQNENERFILEQQKENQLIILLSLGLILVITIIFSIILFRSNKFTRRANRKIEIAYDRLKNTQSQLIHAEKMASLGELTAGIAHEIQNPLNFVNNFSEVSNELIDEMKEELKKGDVDEGLIIADDIKQNLEKIHHHGQRASGIVKGMLEHSRTGDGKKEPTDINALADEYLRLAYHGLRAKDNSFNTDFKTNIDPALPKVDVIPQEIGRVLLNLINNAFYVVDKKAKSGIRDYKPEVIVTTKSHVKSIEISVTDNGDGIPDSIKDKIFQPFFTTKPTGSGTGLGLSLSYDIVKAHGGELKVESKESEGSEFIIQLPIV